MPSLPLHLLLVVGWRQQRGSGYVVYCTTLRLGANLAQGVFTALALMLPPMLHALPPHAAGRWPLLRPQDERPEAIVGNAVIAAKKWVRCLTCAVCNLLNMSESGDGSSGMGPWKLHGMQLVMLKQEGWDLSE